MRGRRRRRARASPSLFSFNSKGACQACQGLGVTYLAFLDPIDSPCETCGGKRFTEAVSKLLERQRLKLATELGEKSRIYVLDEPTTGLHSGDVDRLARIFERLVENGSTVILIEQGRRLAERLAS